MEFQKFQSKNEIIRYFTNIWPEDSKPLAKLFKTDSKGYLYDTGTNKIFACNELEYLILNNLLSMDIKNAVEKSILNNFHSQKEYYTAYEAIRSAIDNENVLKTKKDSIQFRLLSEKEKAKEAINNSLGMVQLEVTERCNLRCGYCIYDSNRPDKRNHGTQDMNQEIAFRSIDYLANHSKMSEEVSITFYGGEPLLCFPLIQSCVKYAHKVFRDKKHRFSVTTNASLLTSEMVKFFSKENFGVLVSLDGPEHIHDQYRKDTQGNGSFKNTISGLKKLFKESGKSDLYISLSMVYSPPYSEQKLDQILTLWEEYPWISKTIPIAFTYVEEPFTKKNKNHPEWDFSLFDWAKNNYLKDYRNGEKTNIIASGIIENKLAHFIQRPIYPNPLTFASFNGCCIPATRKLYISTSGSFSVCERIGLVPEIGNIKSGIDIEQIYTIYFDEYGNKSITKCSECWLLNLCTICYQVAFHNGKLDMDKKNIYCNGQKKLIKKFLQLYLSLLEINNMGLIHLNDIEIK